jgi:hypothetical protein
MELSRECFGICPNVGGARGSHSHKASSNLSSSGARSAALEYSSDGKAVASVRRAYYAACGCLQGGGLAGQSGRVPYPIGSQTPLLGSWDGFCTIGPDIGSVRGGAGALGRGPNGQVVINMLSPELVHNLSGSELFPGLLVQLEKAGSFGVEPVVEIEDVPGIHVVGDVVVAADKVASRRRSQGPKFRRDTQEEVARKELDVNGLELRVTFESHILKKTQVQVRCMKSAFGWPQ